MGAVSPEPRDYVTPPFPSLYWFLPINGNQAVYLYHTPDIWRFTLYWTLILYGGMHFLVSMYAVAMQWRAWKVVWVVPVVYLVMGGMEAIIAGSVVGGLLGSVYTSGTFDMSTWIPFVWALINSLVLILSSFAMGGGL